MLLAAPASAKPEARTLERDSQFVALALSISVVILFGGAFVVGSVLRLLLLVLSADCGATRGIWITDAVGGQARP